MAHQVFADVAKHLGKYITDFDDHWVSAIHLLHGSFPARGFKRRNFFRVIEDLPHYLIWFYVLFSSDLEEFLNKDILIKDLHVLNFSEGAYYLILELNTRHQR